MIRTCGKHGDTNHYVRKERKDGWRCSKCLNEAVNRRRNKIKRLLVEEHGGQCKICGYNRYDGALDFHHIDPSQKDFAVSAGGFNRSKERSREEAAKCVLLCRNCHAEVERGITTLE